MRLSRAIRRIGIPPLTLFLSATAVADMAQDSSWQQRRLQMEQERAEMIRRFEMDRQAWEKQWEAEKAARMLQRDIDLNARQNQYRLEREQRRRYWQQQHDLMQHAVDHMSGVYHTHEYNQADGQVGVPQGQ